MPATQKFCAERIIRAPAKPHCSVAHEDTKRTKYLLLPSIRTDQRLPERTAAAHPNLNHPTSSRLRLTNQICENAPLPTALPAPLYISSSSPSPSNSLTAQAAGATFGLVGSRGTGRRGALARIKFAEPRELESQQHNSIMVMGREKVYNGVYGVRFQGA